jgi:hypothetical protein
VEVRRVIDNDDISPTASNYPGRVTIANNHISGCDDYGIYLEGTNLNSAALCPVLVTGNIIERCVTSGILVQSYYNGTVITNNVFIGPFGGSARAGVEFNANIQYLTIAGNIFISLGTNIYGLRGPSTASFMTDAATFPGGEADAYLSIRGNKFYGLTATYESTGLIRNISAYYAGEESRGVETIQGKHVVRQITSVTGNLSEWQDSSSNVVHSIDQAGKLAGSVPASVKAAIAAAADLAALKTALAGLFA